MLRVTELVLCISFGQNTKPHFEVGGDSTAAAAPPDSDATVGFVAAVAVAVPGVAATPLRAFNTTLSVLVCLELDCRLVHITCLPGCRSQAPNSIFFN